MAATYIECPPSPICGTPPYIPRDKKRARPYTPYTPPAKRFYPTPASSGPATPDRTPLRDRCNNTLKVSPPRTAKNYHNIIIEYDTEEAQHLAEDCLRKLLDEHTEIILKAFRNGGLGRGIKRRWDERVDEPTKEKQQTPQNTRSLADELCGAGSFHFDAPMPCKAEPAMQKEADAEVVRPMKKLRTRKTRGDVGRPRSDFIPTLHPSEKEKELAALKEAEVEACYYEIVELLSGISVSAQDTISDPRNKFTHVIRIVAKDDIDPCADSLARIRILNDVAGGLHKLELIVPAVDLPRSEDPDDDEVTFAPLRLSSRQLRAARDLMSLALPLSIRPEYPSKFEEFRKIVPHLFAHLDDNGPLDHLPYHNVLIHGDKSVAAEVMAIVACYITYSRNDDVPYTLDSLVKNLWAESDTMAHAGWSICGDDSAMERIRKVAINPL